MVQDSFNHISHHRSPAEDHVEDEQEQQLGHHQISCEQAWGTQWGEGLEVLLSQDRMEITK